MTLFIPWLEVTSNHLKGFKGSLSLTIRKKTPTELSCELQKPWVYSHQGLPYRTLPCPNLHRRLSFGLSVNSPTLRVKNWHPDLKVLVYSSSQNHGSGKWMNMGPLKISLVSRGPFPLPWLWEEEYTLWVVKGVEVIEHLMIWNYQ